MAATPSVRPLVTDVPAPVPAVATTVPAATVDVFYVSYLARIHEDGEEVRVAVGKFFSKSDAETFMADTNFRKGVRVDMKTESVASQHPSHRSP